MYNLAFHPLPAPMKIFSAAAAIFLCCLFFSAPVLHALPPQKKQTVRVGVYENPPQVFRNAQGKYQGLEIELLEHVAAQEGWDLTYMPGSWPQCLARLRDGRIDLQVAIAYSEKRAAQYAFNREPIFSNWGQFFSLPDTQLTSILALDKKTLALVKKDIHTIAFTKLAQKFDLHPTYIYVDTYSEALQLVADHVADAGLVNRLFGNQRGADFGVVKTPILFNPIEIHYAAPLHGSRDLLSAIDVHLKRLKENPDSLYYQAIERWITAGATTTLPPGWVMPVIKSMAALLLIILAVFLYTHYQVQIKTIELRRLLKKETKLRNELAKSEEKFRLAFHISPDAITLSGEDGRLVEVNQGFCVSTGYDRSEVIGRDPVELGLWKNPEERMQLRFQLLNAGRMDLDEVEYVRKDGQTIQAQVSAVRFEYDGSIYFLSICHDISQFKAQQKALEQAEQQWRQTFDAITDLITVQNKERRVLLANRAARDYFKTDKNGNQACLRLHACEDKPCPTCPIEQTFHEKTPQSSVIHLEKSNKSFFVSTHPIFNAEEEPDQIVLVARDITKEIALEKERILLAVAIEQATEAVIITDRDANIRYVNKAFERNTGYTRNEVMGKNPRLLQSGKHDRFFYQDMWATLLSGKTWHGCLVNRRKNGELQEEEASISPVVDQHGELINYIAVTRDITHERELEQQLQQAQKLEAIGTLAGGISHDFNNILGAILGFAEMASMQLPENHPARIDITNIITASHRAVDLVKQILTFSRQDSREFHPVQLQYILREAIKLLTASLPATISLRQQIDNSCPTVLGDPTLLHQVILNLCTNAKHAIGDNQGCISISLTQHANARELWPSRKPAVDSCIILEVSDDGCGMDAETRKRIFDPFFTTKSKDKGTGLGLSVTHGIIQQHGGEIQVSSVPGQGSTFRVFLPIVDQECQEEVSKTPSQLPGGTEHIVLVDDEASLADIFRRILAGLGYRVTMFTSSAEALQFVEQHIEDIDLLLTDMTMPGMTGVGLALRALGLKAGLPVILCTGFSEAIDQNEATALGISAFLLKPVSKQQLAESVDRLLHAS
jgi:PAS domain S-box-containing protein